MIAAGQGNPTTHGLYAVEIFFGWKLLEWHGDGWWHMQKVGRWTADDPVQWVGPLPDRKTVKGNKGAPPRKIDYDL